MHATATWSAHAIREFVDDCATGLRGNLGFLRQDPDQRTVDRAWSLVEKACGLSARLIEDAIRAGVPELDDQESDGKILRWFRLPSSPKILRKAVLALSMNHSSNHPGEFKVITVMVETCEILGN